MVGVGGLAAIINVVVLVTVAVADRAIGLTVRNFAASSLKNRQRAPVVHDSDTWLPNIPRSVVKYYRHPAILLTVLCTVLLIASELVTEIGVDVSDTCGPVKVSGSVITPGDITGRVTVVEKGASAFLLQNLTFKDGPLRRVPAGLPRRIRGNECLLCMDESPDTYPDIVNNCTVKASRVYAAEELEIGVDGSPGKSPFGNVTIGFRELIGDREVFLAHEDGLQGDITYNGVNYAAFIFYGTSEKSTDEVTYFEYFNKEHIRNLINEVKNKPHRTWEATASDVLTWKIKCGKNQLSGEHFRTALSVYRTIQLENPVNPASFDENTMRFGQLEVEDVYRASLSIKVIDDDSLQGEYFAYTTCGVYRWKFIIPMTVSLVAVLGLGVISIIVSPDKGMVRSIPYNSRTWFRHARRVENDVEPEDLELQTIREQNVGSMTHEMFVLEFGEAPDAVPQIGLRSKRRHYDNTYPEPKTPPSGSIDTW